MPRPILRSSSRTSAIVASLALSLSALAAAPAARGDSVLSPGTRPFWASFGLGPSIFIATQNGDPGATWLHLNEQLGYHFSGRSDGPAIALDVHQLIGNFGLANHFSLRLDARFLYDIPLSSGLALFLTPSAAVGWHWLNLSSSLGPLTLARSWNGLDLNAAVELRMILGNRGLLFVRPVGLSFPIMFYDERGTTRSRVLLSYELLFGGGATF